MMTTPPATNRADTSLTGLGKVKIRRTEAPRPLDCVCVMTMLPSVRTRPGSSPAAYRFATKVPVRCQSPVKPLKGPPTTWLVQFRTKACVLALYVPVTGAVRPGSAPPGLGEPWLK